LANRDVPAFLAQRLLLDRGGQLETELVSHSETGLKLGELLEASRARLAECDCRVPAAEARVRYAWARRVLEGAADRPAVRPVSRSDRIDRVLTHKVAGLAIFATLMFLVFQTIYSWAGPLMDLVETGQGYAAGLIEGQLSPGPLRSLLVDGVIAGVGGVLIFLPQICLLFLFLAILEDCDNMATRRIRHDARPVAGTRLFREYRGVEHTVTVLADGYEWEGRPYRSLSAIARAITGTRWNGLVFFGVKRQGSAA
jgi:ferrous iron transport protein B